MTSPIWRTGVLALLVAAAGTGVSAQTDNVFAIGGTVAPNISADEDAGAVTGYGLLWRFGRGGEGWGWRYGLNWYQTEINREIADRTLAFGRLRIRPVMAGYGYGWSWDRAVVSVNLLGGYSVNAFSLRPTFDDAYRRALGAETIVADVSNAFVLKPEISTWIDISRRVGLNVSFGYMLARPEATITSSIGTDQERVRADMLLLKIGAVYSVF
jgi:hypothetical protein